MSRWWLGSVVVVLTAWGLLFPDGAGARQQAAVKKTAAKAPAVVRIRFSHQLDAADTGRLAALVERFHAGQTEVRIELVRVAATVKPAVLNLATPEVMAQFLQRKNAFKPVFQLLQETGEALPAASISADLLVGQQRQKLTALPVAYSTPVLFYNKRAFRQAGLDPEAPPRTWEEMVKVSGQLIAHGQSCPYTSSWPTWIHIDNLTTVANEAVADKGGRLRFNGWLQVKHIAMLASWHEAGYFRNFGRADEADTAFYRGECAMLTSNASAHGRLRDAPGVELGIAALPYHDDQPKAAGHTLAAGASIWIGSGYKPTEYRAAARFIRFLLQPKVQGELARVGGFLPLTDAVRQSLRSELQRDEEYAFDVAYASLQGRGATPPLRVSALAPLRLIVDEELEQVWANRKTAKAALDIAVKRGNAVLAAKPSLKRAVAY